jgi:hypothetical protein
MDGVATRFALAGDERELSRGLAKVDAEIGGADDVVVSQEDLAALKKFHAPVVPPITGETAEPISSASAVSPGPSAGPAAPPQVQQKSGSRSRWIISAVVIFLILRAMGGAKKRSR